MLFQLYVYGPVAPLALTLTEPLAEPQMAGVNEPVKLKSVGWVMFTEAEAVHPLASVMVTE